MEKIVIAAVIALVSFWVSGKPYVTPPEIGPVIKTPPVEKPNVNYVTQEPSKDLTKAIPNSPSPW